MFFLNSFGCVFYVFLMILICFDYIYAFGCMFYVFLMIIPCFSYVFNDFLMVFL